MYSTLVGADASKLAGYVSSNSGLDTKKFPYNDPTASNRYSRYAVAESSIKVEVNSAGAPVGSQWKTINETGSKNCCGGGFIRKFEDGTTNWTVRNRLNISPENFACLNYKTNLYKESANNSNSFVKSNWSSDYSFLCLYPTKDEDGNFAGCIQENMAYENIPYDEIDTLSPEFKPTPYTNIVSQFSTYPGEGFNDGGGDISLAEMVSSSVIYPPTLFKKSSLGFTNKYFVFRNSTQYDNVDLNDRAISFYFPAYITDISKINTATITAQLRGDGFTATSRLLTQHLGPCSYTAMEANSAVAPNTWCTGTDGSRSYMAFYVQGTDTAPDDWQWGWLEFNFTENNPLGAMTPGSAQYYEQRLSKFELLGIPQVTQNYIACNDGPSADPLTLIPGFYQETTKALAGFDTARVHFKTDNSTIKHGQIFAANDFRCCSKVGNKVDVATKCCTGYGERTGSETQYTCKIPKGADLHLYLNKFVSSEGSYSLDDAQDDDEKLLDSDFDSETGYPKYNEKVYNLIRAFGEEHCSTKKVREGGAIGNFSAQPGTIQNTDRRSIVDSILDVDDSTGAGYLSFMSGYRWNIHTYCD